MRYSTCAASLLLLAATPAAAASISLTGSYAHQNPPAALSGRCAPAARTVTFGPGIAPASGTSNLGDFVPSGSHCIVPPLPTSYSGGLFSFDFGGGDTLFGSYSGALSATDDPTTFANLQDYIVTGGTGRFLGATGSFRGEGSVTFAAGRLPASTQTLAGTISAPAIPEPATWAMLVGGFGLLGSVLRRQRPLAARLG